MQTDALLINALTKSIATFKFYHCYCIRLQDSGNSWYMQYKYLGNSHIKIDHKLLEM